MRQCLGQGVFEMGQKWTGRAGGHSDPTWSSLPSLGRRGWPMRYDSEMGFGGGGRRETHRSHHNGD